MTRARTAGVAVLATVAIGTAGVGAAAVVRSPGAQERATAARDAAGAPQVAAAATAAAPVAALSWSRCAGAELRAAGARCTRLSVPLDHAKPDGSRITVAVSRIAATAPAAQRQGPLLVNPGGPGGEGLAYSARMKRRLPAALAKTFDIVGFDPRGVGASRPVLSCVPDYGKGPRPDYEPTTGPAGPVSPPETRWLARSAKYAAACAENHPHLIRRMRTVDAVRDIELLRRSLGAARINFYGYSYGTYLAQVYATLFPTRVRRLVLDGVVDPRYVWYTAQLNQDRAFETAIRRFWAWVARHHGTYGLGDTQSKVTSRFYREQDDLRGRARGQIGPSEWTSVFLPAAYAPSTWPTLAEAWRSWERGDRAPLTGVYERTADIGDDNGFAVYNAVQCTDAPWPRDYATWRRDAFATAAVAPYETWANVWYNTPCIYWAVPPGVPVTIAPRPVRALLVSTTLDGATPYAGALEVRRRWGRSALVAEVGSTAHTAGFSGNRCVDDRISAYLRSGRLPARVSGSKADVRCAQRAAPRP